MAAQTLRIKNMVCNRCIKVVADELQRLDHKIKSIELGRVELITSLEHDEIENIDKALRVHGFELLDDKKEQLIEHTKILIIDWIQSGLMLDKKLNISTHLSQETGHDYSYLSHLFSSVEGITIEKFLILHKIEKVKELIAYEELSFKEIAYQLDYSSVQHLSNQFKKITGFPPSIFKKKFKKNKNWFRTPLDKV